MEKNSPQTDRPKLCTKIGPKLLSLAAIIALTPILPPTLQASPSAAQSTTPAPALVALDTETGGFSPDRNGLVSVGAVNTQNQTFEGVITPQPHLKYDTGALKVNGFTQTNNPPGWSKPNTDTGEIQKMNSQNEKTVLLNLFSFLNACGQNTPLAGCNLQFDLRFLKQAAARQNLTREYEAAFNRPIIELRDLAKEAHRNQTIQLPEKKNKKGPTLTLDAIAQSVGLQRNPHGFHDGLEDARLTLLCAQKLLATPQPKQPLTKP
jgi:DNA polymerase III epsilon subunit-like protein